MKTLKENSFGLLLCFAIAFPVWLLVRLCAPLEVIGAPVLAILVGMALTRHLRRRERFSPGISYTSKKILQYAVILLGFGLNLATVGRVGLSSLPIILSTITTSLVTAYLMHRLLHVPAKISTLVGVGSSICGGSAIAATAPVIDADDSEIAQAISVIFLFNIIAAVIFPSIGSLWACPTTVSRCLQAPPSTTPLPSPLPPPLGIPFTPPAAPCWKTRPL